jgi:hypothetical protein
MRQSETLALLGDPSHVRANLRDATFDHYLERYLLVWAKARNSHSCSCRASPTHERGSRTGPSRARAAAASTS